MISENQFHQAIESRKYQQNIFLHSPPLPGNLAQRFWSVHGAEEGVGGLNERQVIRLEVSSWPQN